MLFQKLRSWMGSLRGVITFPNLSMLSLSCKELSFILIAKQMSFLL